MTGGAEAAESGGTTTTTGGLPLGVEAGFEGGRGTVWHPASRTTAATAAARAQDEEVRKEGIRRF